MTNNYLSRDHRRYIKVSPGSIYEDTVQHIVLRNIESLFPGYVAKIMDPYFKTAAGDVKPDLVMVKRDLSDWGLIEVETDTHSFSAHVLPQMAKLSYARADENVAAKILGEFDNLFDSDKLVDLLGKKPIVYLITHGKTDPYEKLLEELNIEVIDIEIHTCPPGDYVLSVADKSRVYIQTGWYAFRSKSPLLKNLWNISNFEIDMPSDLAGKIPVEYDNNISIWSFEKFGSSLTLRCPADLPMSAEVDKVEVFKQKDSWNFKFFHGQ